MGKRRRGRERHQHGAIPAPRGGGGRFSRTVRTYADPRTPADERHDAAAEVYTQLAGELASELHHGDLDEIRHDAFALLNRPDVMAKAVRLEPYAYPTAPPAGHPRVHSSILAINEFGVVDSPEGKSRWFEKPGTSGFHVLKDMATNVDILGAIDLTFLRQVLRFIRPEREEGPQGLRIARVDGEKIGAGERREVQRIERMLFQGGDVEDYFERQRLQRSELPSFVSKFVKDSLAADACPIELTRTNGGKLSGWHNVDFTTVRLCSEYGYEGRDEIRGVQLIDSVPRIAYEYRDLLYEIRNPRTDIYAGGYGMAEAEMLLRVTTGYLHTVAYNLAGLDRNATPRGILTLVGKGIFAAENRLEDTKRHILAMMTGPNNRFKFPIVASEDGPGAHWTPMDQFNEMLFTRLAIFLIAIACAVKGMDPSVVHFDSFSTRTSSLTGTDTAEKLSLSRDKGLLPLLDFVERVLSVIVGQINPAYRVQLVGVHEEDEARKHELIKLTRTTDEIREMGGAPPMKDKVLGGAFPGNPQLTGVHVARAGGFVDEDREPARGRGGDDERPAARRQRPRPDDDDLVKAAVVVIHRDAEV